MEFSVEYSIIQIFNSYSPSPVHHTVKQLTMTLNALLASAETEGVWCMHLRVCAIVPNALTAAPVMNAKPFLRHCLCECIKAVMNI